MHETPRPGITTSILPVISWLQGRARQGSTGGIRKGAYAGPARILAMETKLQGGHVAPGSCVWLVRGMRLIKAAVEQLRMATEREVLVHELSVKESAGPWTMTRLTDALGPHDFDDVSGDGVPPDDADPEDMEVEQDEDEELIPASPSRSPIEEKATVDVPNNKRASEERTFTS